ncbi:hypothetical protein DL95DRAFT_398146, partial [Leptodontidium sp. 2 PMI_412]
DVAYCKSIIGCTSRLPSASPDPRIVRLAWWGYNSVNAHVVSSSSTISCFLIILSYSIPKYYFFAPASSMAKASVPETQATKDTPAKA